MRLTAGVIWIPGFLCGEVETLSSSPGFCGNDADWINTLIKTITCKYFYGARSKLALILRFDVYAMLSLNKAYIQGRSYLLILPDYWSGEIKKRVGPLHAGRMVVMTSDMKRTLLLLLFERSAEKSQGEKLCS